MSYLFSVGAGGPLQAARVLYSLVYLLTDCLVGRLNERNSSSRRHLSRCKHLAVLRVIVNRVYLSGPETTLAVTCLLTLYKQLGLQQVWQRYNWYTGSWWPLLLHLLYGKEGLYRGFLLVVPCQPPVGHKRFEAIKPTFVTWNVGKYCGSDREPELLIKMVKLAVWALGYFPGHVYSLL